LRKQKEDSSFSEEKEAKRLCLFGASVRAFALPGINGQMFFASFFQK